MPLLITRGLGPSSHAPAPTPASLPTSPAPSPSEFATDFGQDFDFLNGLNPRMPLVGAFYNLGQALAHRLETPRGGLFYDPDYGTDVRGYLNMPMTPQTVTQLVTESQSECLKDARVQTMTISAQADAARDTLNLTLNGTTADGPFAFVLAVTDVTVELLSNVSNG